MQQATTKKLQAEGKKTLLMGKEFIVEIENFYGVKLFITGGTYKFSGEKYACVSEIMSRAKRYSSRGRAISAGNRLAASCKNIKWINILEVE